jgi:hydroxymethylbilane synthase
MCRHHDQLDQRAALHAHAEKLEALLPRRGRRPLFLIDLAVPRDFEPSINLLDDVYLYDIDDLQSIAHAHLRERQTEIARSLEILQAARGPLRGLGRATAGRARGGRPYRRTCHSMKPIILGTRGSPLALIQTRQVMADLKKAWPGRNFEIHVIKTEGDKLAERALSEPVKLGKGLFTAELEKALIEGSIDLAIHSLKDLPTTMAPGLMLASVPKRADAHDVLITRSADYAPAQQTGWVTASGSLRRVLLGPELNYEAVIATGSPRRVAQLKNVRNDLKTVPIRGNIETRIKKFRENQEWSGIVLAQAGIDRLKPDVAGLNLTKMPFAHDAARTGTRRARPPSAHGEFRRRAGPRSRAA